MQFAKCGRPSPILFAGIHSSKQPLPAEPALVESENDNLGGDDPELSKWGEEQRQHQQRSCVNQEPPNAVLSLLTLEPARHRR